ncbi:uncharacterized protein BJX67DRAFT_356745 [Aspergillus lucknowensis]|uniref:F-box domain-containing protein n=1 Tax=Aspergillus lucknowensis TaxID=176173 RepID=A0ABR4LMY5_9EURO
MADKSSTRKRTRTSSKPSQKRSKRGPTDPLECLHSDIINILFGLLPAADVVRCERVSRTWQANTTEWMATCGVRIHFPDIWHMGRIEATASAYKQHARLSSPIASGNPASIRQLPQCLKSALAGDYLAWTVNSNGDLRPSVTSDLVYWQCLARAEDGSIQRPTVLPSNRFLRRSGGPVQVADMDLNHDGILLLRLDDSEGRSKLTGRTMVYSPVEKEVLWRRDYVLGDGVNESVPLLIGKRRVYCAVIEQDGYRLVAHDFRQDDLLCSGPLLPRTWDPVNVIRFSLEGYRRMHFCSGREQRFRLFDRDGEEFILEVHPIVHGRPKASIINGANGHPVQTIDFPEQSVGCFIKDPVASRIAVVSQPGRLSAETHRYLETRGVILIRTHQPLETHRVILIRRFSLAAGGLLSQLPADVIFFPLDHMVKEYDWRRPLLGAHPSGLGVLSAFCHPEAFGNYPPWVVRGHALVVTRDESYRTAANAILQDVFQVNPPPGFQCSIAQPGSLLTLPPRPDIGRHTRVEFVIPKHHHPRSMQFVDWGRALVEHGGGYIIAF